MVTFLHFLNHRLYSDSVENVKKMMRSPFSVEVKRKQKSRPFNLASSTLP